MKRLPWPALLVVVAGCTPVVKEYQDLKQKNYNKYFASHKQPEYRGDSLKNIMFPVGGIGTGDLLLGGRGEIRSLEIFGRPSAVPDDSMVVFFALWLKEAGEFNSVEEVGFEPECRILERRLSEDLGGPHGASGPVPGLPRFREALFTGTYPVAEITLSDPAVPVGVEAEVFNPLIPLDLGNSSLPSAIFHWMLTNKLEKDVEVSMLFFMTNPFSARAGAAASGKGDQRTEPIRVGDFRGFTFTAGQDGDATGHSGDFSVTGLPEMNVRTDLGTGPGEIQSLWQDFREDGELKEDGRTGAPDAGRGTAAACWVKKTLKPGDVLTLPFILTWYVPRREIPAETRVAGDPRASGRGSANSGSAQLMDNQYAGRFDGSARVAETIIRNREYLHDKTMEYTAALRGSSYPDYVVDALSAGTAALKTNLVSVDGRGRVMAYSGLLDDAVAGPVNCSNIWIHNFTHFSTEVIVKINFSFFAVIIDNRIEHVTKFFFVGHFSSPMVI